MRNRQRPREVAAQDQSEFVRAHLAHAAHIAPATASPVSESRLVIPYSVCFIWRLFTMLLHLFIRGVSVCTTGVAGLI